MCKVSELRTWIVSSNANTIHRSLVFRIALGGEWAIYDRLETHPIIFNSTQCGFIFQFGQGSVFSARARDIVSAIRQGCSETEL